jgi:hypothetical protein
MIGGAWSSASGAAGCAGYDAGRGLIASDPHPGCLVAARGLIILVGCLFYRNTVSVCAVQGAAAEAPPGAGATGFEGIIIMR